MTHAGVFDGIRLPRLPLRLHRRGRLRDLRAGRATPRRSAARAAGRARVKPIGLGARDSLRLEAGLPLYGHDIDETTSPVEADLAFAISKRRREAAAFPAPSASCRARRRAAARPRRPRWWTAARRRAKAPRSATPPARPSARVTTGGFARPSARPIAMGYVAPALAAPGTALVRSRCAAAPQPATVAPLPFVPHRYFRKPAS